MALFSTSRTIFRYVHLKESIFTACKYKAVPCVSFSALGCRLSACSLRVLRLSPVSVSLAMLAGQAFHKVTALLPVFYHCLNKNI
jgi:hypothetical protein